MRSDMTDQSESVGARLRDAHNHRADVLQEVEEAQDHLGALLNKVDEIDNDIARLADEDLQRCGGNGRG
jgi:hypothetical protein